MGKNTGTGALSLERAIADPAAVFAAPEDVLKDTRLSPANKLEILQRWAHDADRLAVAEAEGMGGGEPSLQGRVLQALNEMTRRISSEAEPHENSLPRADPAELE